MSKICYYGDRLSPNIAKTPEGFIICQNVPIARTGYQKYLESELVEDGSDDIILHVYRPPEEVFSLATLASFEGKPVTNGHPEVDVTPDNYRTLAAGHVQNVRAGSGDDSNKILADLYITDPTLIQEVMDGGKRQVSAGYYAEDKEDERGRVYQTQIRGNHVAVVDHGRAGSSVCIRDQRMEGMKKKGIAKKGGKLTRLLVKYIRDASNENIDDRIEEVQEILDEGILGEGEVLDGKCPRSRDGFEDDDELVGSDLEDEGEFEDSDLEDEEELVDSDLEDEGEFEDSDLEDEEELVDSDLEDEGEFEGGFEDSDPENIELELRDIFKEFEARVKELVLKGKSSESLLDEDGLAEDEDEDGLAEDEDDVSVIPTDEVEARLASKDAAIRKLKRAVARIKNTRDRARVRDALSRATKRKRRRSQMSGLMSVVRDNQKRRVDGTKVLNVQKQQISYDALNPHKGE